MANSPEFPWHLTNLNNYLDLTPVYPAGKAIRGHNLAPFGMGGGLVGLPGDFTPPSRFIRIATYLQNLPPQETTAKAVKTAFHLLNNFDLPPGSKSAFRDIRELFRLHVMDVGERPEESTILLENLR